MRFFSLAHVNKSESMLTWCSSSSSSSIHKRNRSSSKRPTPEGHLKKSGPALRERGEWRENSTYLFIVFGCLRMSSRNRGQFL